VAGQRHYKIRDGPPTENKVNGTQWVAALGPCGLWRNRDNTRVEMEPKWRIKERIHRGPAGLDGVGSKHVNNRQTLSCSIFR